jgi:hypothetical protein
VPHREEVEIERDNRLRFKKARIVSSDRAHLPGRSNGRVALYATDNQLKSCRGSFGVSKRTDGRFDFIVRWAGFRIG